MERRGKFLPSKTEGEFSKHPPGKILLDGGDLLELFLASRFGDPNWHPGHAIQVGDFNLAQNPLAQQALRHLLYIGRYGSSRQGCQTILNPNEIDETVKAAIELGGIASLEALIKIFSQFSEIISSVTLLPNTSLGVKKTGSVFSQKINGVILEINIKDGRLKHLVAQLVNQMGWPLGRVISVVGLKGIDINSFVLHFGEGDDLKAGVLGKGVKFVDFYFGLNGKMYLVFAAGGERDLPANFFMGTGIQFGENLSNLLKDQKALHDQINNVIVSRIGGGVIPDEEVLFSFPYVGAYFDPEKGLLLVSGACLNKGSSFFNQGPNNPGILINGGDLLHPVGIKSGNLVTMSKSDKIVVPNGTSLIPVRRFGLL